MTSPSESESRTERRAAAPADSRDRLHVVHFQRKAAPRQYSVERLFGDVRSAMPEDIRVDVRINRFPSRGILGRVRDAIGAFRARGRINHVLGDVQYLACFLPRRRTISTVLDCVSLERLTGVRRWVLWFFWYWWPLKRSTRVTVISTFSGETLREWVRYPADRIHVIPPTLSSEFQPDRRPLDLERPRLLHIGTKPNKNLPRVVEAISGLPVTLAVVGTPDDETRSRLDELGIEYVTYDDLSSEALVEQYRLADIMVFASTYEGFGLPIIEAQATGRPVLTGNLCSMPEAAGGAACLVDPFDVDDIRRGLLAIMNDPSYASDLVEKGFVNARRYAPERIAEDYAEVYRLVAKG